MSYSSGLTEYTGTLPWAPSQSLDWERQDFDPVRVVFTDSLDQEPPPVRLSRYKDPVRGTHRYYLSQNNQWAQVDLEWARYAVLHSARQSLLVYDSSRFTLAVPQTAPLPFLLARSAVLCTGYVTRAADLNINLANRKQTGSYEMYEGVPEPLAQKIAEKLGQRLVIAQIDVQFED